MTLLISLILGAEVKVITTNNNSSVHGGALNNTTQKMPTNANITGEWAFLVNIVANNSFTWSLEAKTDGVIVTN